VKKEEISIFISVLKVFAVIQLVGGWEIPSQVCLS